MENATIAFARAARTADVAPFYYSGHALQLQSVNYLSPVDAVLKDETDLRRMIRVDQFVADLQQAKNLRILILDSCRNNPTRAIPADNTIWVWYIRSAWAFDWTMREACRGRAKPPPRAIPTLVQPANSATAFARTIVRQLPGTASPPNSDSPLPRTILPSCTTRAKGLHGIADRPQYGIEEPPRTATSHQSHRMDSGVACRPSANPRLPSWLP